MSIPNNGFARLVWFDKGHTIRRSRGDNKDYGVSTSHIRFCLVGANGTVQLRLSTGWVPQKHGIHWDSGSPEGSGIRFHWDSPKYDGQDGPDLSCDMRRSGQCFYDISYTAAEPVLDRLFYNGEEAMWSELERLYDEWDSQ